MTNDQLSTLLLVAMAGLMAGLWLGQVLRDSRWQHAADSARMTIRVHGADYYVVRAGDVKRAEDVAALNRQERP